MKIYSVFVLALCLIDCNAASTATSLMNGSLNRNLVHRFTLTSADYYYGTNTIDRGSAGLKAWSANTPSFKTGLWGNNAQLFNGTSDRVWLENTFGGVYLPSSNISMCCWLCTSNSAVTQRPMTFWATNSNNIFSFQVFNNGIRALIGYAGGGQVISSPVAITSNVWWHVGMSFDGANMVFYTNGLPAMTNAAATSIYTNESRLVMGSAYSTEYWMGTLQDARVYHRVLGASDFKLIFQQKNCNMDNFAPFQLVRPSPFIFYDFDMDSDIDDVADALTLLNLHRSGAISMIGSVATTSNRYSGVLFKSLANYYSVNIPEGVNTNASPAGGTAAYPSNTVAVFPAPGYASSDDFPDYRVIQRTALASAADHSISYITTGDLSSVQGLMQTVGDGISPLTGLDLMSLKLQSCFVVGGNWPYGIGVSDLGGNATLAAISAYVLTNWPSTIPLLFMDLQQSVGNIVGSNVFVALSTSNPARFAWTNAFGNANATNAVQCYSQLAIIPMSFGISPFTQTGQHVSYLPYRNGTGSIDATTGATTWFPLPKANHWIIQRRLKVQDWIALENSYIHEPL